MPRVQLLSSEQLGETCASSKPVCILAIVPDLLDCDAKCRNNYLSIIADVSKKFRRQGWGCALHAHLNVNMRLMRTRLSELALASVVQMAVDAGERLLEPGEHT